MKKFKLIFPMMIMFVVVIVVAVCQSPKKTKPQKKAIPINTAAVEKKEISLPVYTSGRLFPKSMVKLSFKVGGILENCKVDEGDAVNAGQVLASLKLTEINARFLQAENIWLKTQRDLQRAENLFKDRAATLEQVQDAKTAFTIAQSNLRIASFNREHAVIKAPVKGKILKRFSEKGEMIGPGSPVFLFASTEQHWVVRAGVSERNIIRLKVLDVAEIFFDAYPDQPFKARISEIPDSLDSDSGTYEVELGVEDEGRRLAAGFVAKVRIEPSDSQFYHLIPVDAIVEGEGNYGIVYTNENGKARKIKIEIAHMFNHQVAVKAGLEGIDRVVTSGAAYLTDGCPVKTIR